MDAQLAARGWDVDTPAIRYGAGSRPIKGRNTAIAEWPTKPGPADYALFIGARQLQRRRSIRLSESLAIKVERECRRQNLSRRR
jgi:type I restriction enzyme R subunit